MLFRRKKKEYDKKKSVISAFERVRFSDPPTAEDFRNFYVHLKAYFKTEKEDLERKFKDYLEKGKTKPLEKKINEFSKLIGEFEKKIIEFEQTKSNDALYARLDNLENEVNELKQKYEEVLKSHPDYFYHERLKMWLPVKETKK